ncbi:MAG: NAD(P)H-hydrate dehydratase [Phycisphaerae bacterium]|nr:NAD(P)H-hydrate dehydratase [Phycisphaerae bacterium]
MRTPRPEQPISSPQTLPQRAPDGHKGTFGTVLVIGGCAASPRMIGAPALVSKAALRAGAGLVRVAAPEPIINCVLTINPSATGIPLPADASGRLQFRAARAALARDLASADAVVAGPGLGRSRAARDLIRHVLAHGRAPIVLDADSLHSLPGTHRGRHALSRCVLTPHPGEFRSLAERLGLDCDPVSPESRPAAAASLARALGCVVVLKGASTVVSCGSRMWTDATHDPALATAGTGDVLAGLLGGLVASTHEQRSRFDLFDAACAAVQAHARAAAAWRLARGASAGLLASELADHIPCALEGLRHVNPPRGARRKPRDG